MERWVGRVAVVTGASSGIGAAIVYQLQDYGLHVVALARRADRIPESVESARSAAKTRGRYRETNIAPGTLYSRQCDVQKEEDILSVFKWVSDTLGKVDILVNNAGVIGEKTLSETTTEEWLRILNTNVLGLSICTREAVKIMREKGVNGGHIIHISSVAGHLLPFASNMGMYSASKHAVRALTDGLRKDFKDKDEKHKVTSISPGAVKTEIMPNASQELFDMIAHLQPEDVADAVIFAVGTPEHVQIHELIIKPVGEAF